ncbi:putative zinc-binding protein [Methanoplanus limicola]|uniref:DGC domain protein n=1 Tax=Methanoplanus limicola DSM 2279 TaxID=937775 RepID=H1Z1H0_9EURY|nr:putative zinc-binding protein [Methanoplanus limicola]EHQ36317.1 DGC domain protein [Methanoplanus limicola DSM 2279]
MSELIVVTCSGISNTGRLTGQAVNAFMQRHPGVFERHIPAADISDGLSSDSEVVVIEGCPDCCSCKKLNALGVLPVLHITATDLGIEKRGVDEPAFAEIEILSSELRKALKRL